MKTIWWWRWFVKPRVQPHLVAYALEHGEPLRLCRECKWARYNATGWAFATCKAPQQYEQQVPPERTRHARRWSWCCGHEGAWWEPRTEWRGWQTVVDFWRWLWVLS